MRHPGVPVEHSKLLKSIREPDYGSALECLRSCVRFLRKKIEADPASPDYILTEPWVGYRFRDPSPAEPPRPLLGRMVPSSRSPPYKFFMSDL
jgi:hypothetical protein